MPFRRKKSMRPRRSFKKRSFSKRKRLNMKKDLTVKGLIQPQRMDLNYFDSAFVDGTTNGTATQLMWGSTQNLESKTLGGAGAGVSFGFLNLGTVDAQAVQIIFGGVGASSVNTARFLLNHYKTTSRIKNITSGEVELLHYRCMLRKDANTLGASSNSIPGYIGFQIASAWSTGAVTGVKTPPISTDYGCRPFDLPQLVKHVKVLSTKTYFLKQNAAITLSYSLKKPKLIKWEDYGIFTATSPTTGGPDPDGSSGVRNPKGTHFSIFVLRGTVATNSAGNDKFKMGIGNASILMTNRIEANYQYISPSSQTAAMYTGLQGFSAGACYYPLPITGVYQVQDTVNTTTGARVPITTNPTTIPDFDMFT